MVTKTEILWKKFFEISPDSSNYWSNMFNIADVLFDPENTDDEAQKEINKANQDRLKADLQTIMNYFRQGDYTPNFFLIQHTLSNMINGDFVKVKSDGRITRIYKEQLMNELEKIKSWLFREVGKMPVRFTSPQMNVVNM